MPGFEKIKTPTPSGWTAKPTVGAALTQRYRALRQDPGTAQPTGIDVLIFSKPDAFEYETVHSSRHFCAESSGIGLVCVRVRFLDNKADDQKSMPFHRSITPCFARNTV